VINVEKYEMKYFATSAGLWSEKFFAGVSLVTRSEAKLAGSMRAERGLTARAVFDLAKSAYPCIRAAEIVYGCYQSRSEYRSEDRTVVINAQWLDGNVGCVAMTLHEVSHAIQHAESGVEVMKALREDVEGLVAHEADAWRKAFHLVSKLNVLGEQELHAAKVFAKYCFSSYVHAAGDKLPSRFAWLG
jgi:hypothetical protein